MRNKPTLTTVLRRVGEFNTSLIARLKLPKKSIITRSWHEENEKKTRLESTTRPPSGPSNKLKLPRDGQSWQDWNRHNVYFDF